MRRARPADPPESDPPPMPSKRPAWEDCCHSGCTSCVFDRYDEAYERYLDTLAAWQQARRGQRSVR